MNPILIAVIVLAAIGIVAAALLTVAAKFLSVPQDETFTKVRECLPGANCGGCGYPGCDGYAEAIAGGTETEINKCVAGGASVLQALSEVTGKEATECEKKVAVVCCLGDDTATSKKDVFQGEKTCKAAKLIYGGDGACAFGCIGYGDCAAACPEQAINIINGLAHVNASRCMGCGACMRACPQGVIALLPVSEKPVVLCRNREKGPAVMKVCKAGCIGCGLCAKNCPAGAIRVERNLAEIDPAVCVGCGSCKEVCPRKCIR